MDQFFPQASPAFNEIEKQFATEFDYRGECANAKEVRANLKKAGFANVATCRVDRFTLPLQGERPSVRRLGRCRHRVGPPGSRPRCGAHGSTARSCPPYTRSSARVSSW